MENLLYDKLTIQSIWALISLKFKNAFTKLTGYDIMFEGSRKDIPQMLPTPVQKQKKTINTQVYSWLLHTQSFRSAN